MWSDLIKEMNECVDYGLRNLETQENVEDRVKLLESNILKGRFA